MKKHLTLEQFLESDLKRHTNYYPCGTKKESFYKRTNGWWSKFTYDQNGNELAFENSDGWWSKYTYDQNGNELAYENSDGDWAKFTYDKNGNCTKYEDSDGDWDKTTYDQNGDELAYENSDGTKRGFENTDLKPEQKKDGFTYDESNKIYYKYDYIKN